MRLVLLFFFWNSVSAIMVFSLLSSNSRAMMLGAVVIAIIK